MLLKFSVVSNTVPTEEYVVWTRFFFQLRIILVHDYILINTYPTYSIDFRPFRWISPPRFDDGIFINLSL